jgi:5'-3' exonuclease
MFRSIFAHRNNPQVPATYTYSRMIIGDLKKVAVTSEDMIIMAQDYGKSWRKDIDKNYKAQRKAKREEAEDAEWWKNIFETFNNFFPLIEKSLPFHFIKVYRCESDDIASVACRYYKNKEIILMSSDKDWEMLLCIPNVTIFSPISKKFKVVPNPMKVLLEKIQGDVSDNLLTKPSSEAEFEKRKKIVDLVNPLPDFVEQPIREQLTHILPKNIYVNKFPFKSIVPDLEKIYKED